MSASTMAARSWAQIAKKPDDADSPKAARLQPGDRGSCTCPCVGEVLTMLGHYGWIMVKEAIDHPEAAKHGGRIYIGARDIRGGARLKEGDRVQFFLYADGNGLGAEDCRIAPGFAASKTKDEAPLPPRAESTFSFPPLAATVKTKSDPLAPSVASGVLRAGAAEFTPQVAQP